MSGKYKNNKKKKQTGSNKGLKIGLIALAAVLVLGGGAALMIWGLPGGGDDDTLWQNTADNETESAPGEAEIPLNAPEDTTDTPQTDVPGAHEGPNPIVTIEMEDGAIIRAELFPNTAPNTVNNFIYLIQQGFYDGLTFHRVIPGFMIQGGCPQGTGMGNPGYSIMGEFDMAGFENNLSHTPGVLSMARSNDPHSAGSQFFIVHGDATFLDHEYASFGIVIEGMDVVDAIATTPRNPSDLPDTPQIMRRVTVDTFGVTFPEPDRIG